MADTAKPLKRKAADAPAPVMTLQSNPVELIGGGFDFSGMLAVADMLPVMCAFVSEDLKYRFMNKPMADWFERPRAELLGLTMRELLGEEAWAMREPLVAAAFAGLCFARDSWGDSLQHDRRWRTGISH